MVIVIIVILFAVGIISYEFGYQNGKEDEHERLTKW